MEAMPYLGPGRRRVKKLDHPGESALDRLAAHRLAVAGEMARLAARCAALCRPGEAHHTHGLVAGTAARPGDAGDRERNGGAAVAERAERHFTRRLLAHGAMARQ